MSFQHFRLGELPLHQPQPNTVCPSFSSLYLSVASSSLSSASISSSKPPYGSGDSDDGYTLVFPNLAAFQDWRTAEEDRHCVEFVKVPFFFFLSLCFAYRASQGDTHGSKADPPRFKDHTKLVCARHSRSGRKKYVKKHPERVRKVPSRKVCLPCRSPPCLARIDFLC